MRLFFLAKDVNFNAKYMNILLSFFLKQRNALRYQVLILLGMHQNESHLKTHQPRIVGLPDEVSLKGD